MKPKILIKVAISIPILALGRFLQSLMASPIKQCVIVLVIAGFLSVPGQLVHAEDYWVDTCSSGPSLGSQDYPFWTLSRAVRAAQSNGETDKVHISGGIYPEGAMTIETKLEILEITNSSGEDAVVGGRYEVETNGPICVPAICTKRDNGQTLPPYGSCSMDYYNDANCTLVGQYDTDPATWQGINAMVYSPKEEQLCKAFPTLIYVHGYRAQPDETVTNTLYCGSNWGTPHQSEDYKQAETVLKKLAAAGFIVISVDYTKIGHGSHDTYQEFGTSDPPDRHYANDSGEIVLSTLAYLANHNDGLDLSLKEKVDLYNVGLIGHSRGGVMAYHTAYLYTEGWPRVTFDDWTSPTIAPASYGHYTDEHVLPLLSEVQIKAVGLIGPAQPKFLIETYYLPSLVIYGTNDLGVDHPCAQVENQPITTYCRNNPAKHLVVIEGANHYGHTDNICLRPDSDLCGTKNQSGMELRGDGRGEVGGLSGPDAHNLQRLATAKYLEAFFSHYLRGDISKYDYIQQSEGEQCELVGQDLQIEYSTCHSKLRFGDLDNNNIEVNVCSETSADQD